MPEATIALVCWLDDFATLVEQWEPHHPLPSGRQPVRGGTLSLAQMLSILALFHLSDDKDSTMSGAMASQKTTGPAWAYSPVRDGL